MVSVARLCLCVLALVAAAGSLSTEELLAHPGKSPTLGADALSNRGAPHPHNKSCAVMYMHIPKTAGTSAIMDIHRLNPESHPRLGVKSKGEFCLNFILQEDTWLLRPAVGSPARGPSSIPKYGARGLKKKNPFGPSPPRVVTLFRNPFDHIKSMYLMCAFSTWGAHVRTQHFPKTGNLGKDFETWLDYYLDHPNTSNKRFGCYNPRNMQAEHLVCKGMQGGRAHTTEGYTLTDVLQSLEYVHMYGVTDQYNSFMAGQSNTNCAPF